MSIEQTAEIRNALRNSDCEAIWEAYRLAWEEGRAVPMSPETFGSVFSQPNLATRASDLARNCPTAKRCLAESALNLAPSDFSDRDRMKVVAAAGVDPFALDRTKWPAEARANMIRTAISERLISAGRAVTRQEVLKVWHKLDLEEEREAALLALDSHHALSDAVLRQLGQTAMEIARALSRRGRIHNLATISIGAADLQSKVADPRVVERIGDLLVSLILPLDLRDANLRPRELGELETWHSIPEELAQFLEHAIGIPAHQLARTVRHYQGRSGAAPLTGSSPHQAEFPLLRVFHLREILRAPSLAPALENQSRYLVPDLFLRLLGDEPVAYVPELRVGTESERRWRAIYVESLGEATSVLFVDAALKIDLTTLARIPESNRSVSADFKAKTIDGEPVIFESKGSTDWRTHRSQRREAREQIGKNLSAPVLSRGTVSGRAFACCLYAALTGAKRSSMFYAEDPPFHFAHEFDSNWEQEARRSHFAAVLEFAGQSAAAARLMGEALESARDHEAEYFPSPVEGEPDREQGYRGYWDDLFELARRAHVPNPWAFEGIRVFRGIEDQLHRALLSGEIPVRSWDMDLGVIGSRSERSRGVYSRLGDGSILAIDIRE